MNKISRRLENLQDLEPSLGEFRNSVVCGLSAPRKTLPCKFFYDAEGSTLFDRICELPEYYPTRTECKILENYSDEIAELIGSKVNLVEFGSGAGVKIRLLLNSIKEPAAYIPVDISRSHLIAAAEDLAKDFPDLTIAPVCADYTKWFALPTLSSNTTQNNAGFFPGSTIGNFTNVEASAFLARTRRLLRSGSLMIIGVDLLKDENILRSAYNDSQGVTAAFNLNILKRINRELEGTFDLSQFAHKAIWNASFGRIEMHIISLLSQTVSIGQQQFKFEANETIHTENSYKYSVDQFRQLADGAGYTPLNTWTDENNLFSVHVLRAA